LILQAEQWPESHRRCFADLFTTGDILDESGPASHWAEGSRRKRTQTYGHWLAYLMKREALDLCADPVDLLTPVHVLGFVEDARARISPKSVSMQAEDLLVLANCLGPTRDWSWLRQVVVKLRQGAGAGGIKPRAPVTARQIWEWSRRYMDAARAMPPGVKVAQQFRDGLSVGLLISRPLRVRAFMAIEIGAHLVRRGADYLLRFGPQDMKDRKAREYPVPARLVASLDEYLEIHRPRLLRITGETARLWISARGAPLGIDSFTGNLANLTRRAFGVALRPHAFRHIAATEIATVDPEHVGIVADLLGHATLRMSEKHYNRARGIEAAGRYQAALKDIRRSVCAQSGRATGEEGSS
jgi:hypothetical protein